LIPIDHGYCFPESLEEIEDCCLWFEWMNWSQSKKSFNKDDSELILSIDVEKDIQILSGLGFGEREKRIFKLATELLKRGVREGLSPYCIVEKWVCRNQLNVPSLLEQLVKEEEQKQVEEERKKRMNQ